MSPLTHLYLAFSRVSGPIWRQIHRKRLKAGKETAARLPEKYGHPSQPRPSGTVLWFHALSVGESLALVPLVERALADMPEAHVVLTTSTVTSVAALEGAKLPGRAIHQLLPIDTARATRRFLDHWRPDVAVFAELDFWPRLMIDTHRRGVPMVLVNSRMSDKSLKSRSRLGGMMRDILRLFDALLVQDPESFDRFKSLGADPRRIHVVGALKAAARPLPADPELLDRLRAAIGDRPVWFAAATHPSEELSMLDAHTGVTAALRDALMIAAPRYMDSADRYEAEARGRFRVARRSRGDEITPDTQVYLADTIGEMGLWYRLSPLSFVGHSMPEGEKGGGGKNPYEAAALGSAVIHGPQTWDFHETYQALDERGGARCVRTTDELADAIIDLQDTGERGRMTAAAAQVIQARRAVLDNTWDFVRARL